MKQIVLRVDEELVAIIDDEAEKQHRSRNAQIVHILYAWFPSASRSKEE